MKCVNIKLPNTKPKAEIKAKSWLSGTGLNHSTQQVAGLCECEASLAFASNSKPDRSTQ